MMSDLFDPHRPRRQMPRSDADRCAWLQLIRSPRVGASTFRKLMDEHGSAQASLAALPQVARSAGVARYAAFSADAAAREFAAGRAAGAELVCLGEPDYPAALAQVADAPPVIWIKGRMACLEAPAVALVGARNASALGVRMARHLATDLGADGVCVVSGLARGIDTAAHGAALERGTIAVLAGGIDVAYPPENAELMDKIALTGLLVSEMPPALRPQARHFPRRNRIISGLSRAVVVIEGAARSGSLITARAALDQGREVMAVPGHPFDARATGCNMLIRDGATLVRSAADILAGLGALCPASPARKAPDPAADRSPIAAHAPPPIRVSAPVGRPGPGLPGLILNALGPAPVSEDLLIRQLARPAGEILATLAELDVMGQVRRHPGGLVSSA